MSRPQRLIDPDFRQCEDCGQICGSASGLAHHRRIRGEHSTPTPERHRRDHKPHVCMQSGCLYSCYTATALDKHLLRAHGIDTLASLQAETRGKHRRKAKGKINTDTTPVKKWREEHREEELARRRKTGSRGPISEKMRRAEAGKDSRDWRPRFLEAYARTGFITKAQEMADVSHSHLLQTRHSEPDFARAIQEIADEIRMRRLEQAFAAAWEDGVVGRFEDIYYEGEVVGKRLVRDSKQTQFLLKSLDPQTYDSGVRATTITATAMMASAEERRAQLDTVREMLRGRGQLPPSSVRVVDVAADDRDPDDDD